MTDAAEAFIAHGLSVRWGDLPPRAQAAVKTFLLDTLGVGIAGAVTPLAMTLRGLSGSWAAGGKAHVWGPGALATTPANAAFLNGVQIHCQEYDCVHEGAVVHPMATILAALMADCEARTSVPGEDLGAAIAVAVDMAAGLGLAATSPLKFFRPATAGIFGASLGISRLRGFDARTARSALGHALAFASGTMQPHVEGRPGLPIQIGNAARGAVMACDLAEAGVPGTEDFLDGPFGYFKLFEDSHDLGPVIAGLGENWRIAEVSHKPYPTGRAAQGGIRLMQALREKGVRPEAVKSIRLTAPPLIKRLVGRPMKADMSPSYARLCFAYCGARALIGGTVALEDFSDAALAAPDVLALADRIEVVDDGCGLPAAFTPQVAEVALTTGESIRIRTDALFGSPADPLDAQANIAKFRACAAFGFGGIAPSATDRLVAQVGALEKLDDAAALSRLAMGQET